MQDKDVIYISTCHILRQFSRTTVSAEGCKAMATASQLALTSLTFVFRPLRKPFGRLPVWLGSSLVQDKLTFLTSNSFFRCLSIKKMLSKLPLCYHCVTNIWRLFARHASKAYCTSGVKCNFRFWVIIRLRFLRRYLTFFLRYANYCYCNC